MNFGELPVRYWQRRLGEVQPTTHCALLDVLKRVAPHESTLTPIDPGRTMDIMCYRLATLLSILVLPGCAGGFRSDDQYQAYISGLKLSETSAELAAQRLQHDQFACFPNSDPRLHSLPSTYCAKHISGSLTLIVWLSPILGDDNRCNVEASRSFVFA